MTSASPLAGTVLAVQANYYRVQLDVEMEPGSDTCRELLCTRRARLKKIGVKVMVGDRVGVEEPEWQDGRGAIAEVLPRRSQLDRPAVANVDAILLVFALADPNPDPVQVTRFLVKAESTHLRVLLCLNKADLVSPEQRCAWQQRLRNWGYEAFPISIATQQGLDKLKPHLRGTIVAIAGPSGVGKSSLINALIPQAAIRVGAVGGKLARGRHTTRHVELFEHPYGGLVADTPGFNQPDLTCTPEELAWLFPEARQRLAAASCQFGDCLHREEPNCAVRGDWERYDYYLNLLEETIARADTQHHSPDPESTLKTKVARSGKHRYEPKLELKKYRRTSRRFGHQELQELYQEDLESL